jgi:hypothetical protein
MESATYGRMVGLVDEVMKQQIAINALAEPMFLRLMRGMDPEEREWRSSWEYRLARDHKSLRTVLAEALLGVVRRLDDDVVPSEDW